jgi:uncharacterized protein (UPF0335 family)
MARKKKPQLEIDISAMQPDELSELKKVVKEYVGRMDNLDEEIAGLREAKKDLKSEFESRLDIGTLEKVLKILKVESEVDHKGTYEALYDVLKDDFVNGLVDDLDS